MPVVSETAPTTTTSVIRNRPGTKAKEWYRNAPTKLEQMTSSFPVQQYLTWHYHYRTNNYNNNTENTVPNSLIECPSGQDEQVWLYEHLRLMCTDLNEWVLALAEVCDGARTADTCAEMKAGEWLYLCASHPTPNNCSAIDYVVHTLDAAVAVLNSNKFFPSRVTIPAASTKQFPSIMRRLYRIFAHAWYHHRETFDRLEARTHLYDRTVRLADHYRLMPQKLVVIPGYEMKNPGAQDD